MRYAIMLMGGVLTIAGCAAAHKSTVNENAGLSNKITQTGTVNIRTRPAEGFPQPVASVRDLLPSEQRIGRDIAISAELKLAVTSRDSTSGRIADIAREYRGFVISSSTQKMEITVPEPDFKSAMDRIARLGRVTERKIVSSDMTIQYRDLQLRLETTTKTRDRYLELLAKAVTVEDIIKVEKELERITGTIESLKRELQSAENQVLYARIAIMLSTPVVYKPGPLGYPFYQLYRGAAWLIVHR